MRWILILLLFQALAHEIHAEDLYEKDALNEDVLGNNNELESNLLENDDTLEKREVLEDRSKRAVNNKKQNGKKEKKGKKGKKRKGKKNIRGRKDKPTIKKNKGKKVNDQKGKKKKTKQKKQSSGGRKKKPKKRKKKKKRLPQTNEDAPENKAATNKDATVAGRAAADEASYTGPWGFMNPDKIDWTKPEYRCPECEDTLILYDPWWAPPPILHIPIYCTSNLSSQSSSEGVHNWGPNLTFIWIPGSLNCTNKAKLRNDVSFSVEISQNTTATTGSDQTYYDCGENEAPNELEVGCQEEIIEHHTNKTSHTCFWHMYAYEHWRRQLEFTHWQLPINDCDATPDSNGKVRGLGACCETGPHLKISWTGYAKGFKSYCGRDAPEFYRSPFDKGRARWLIIYNNTHTDHSLHEEHLEFDFKAHTIGYRRTSAIDQYYYGTRCECGLKPKKPSRKMIAQDKPRKKKKKGTKLKKGNKKNKNKNKKKNKNKNKKGKNKEKNVKKVKNQIKKTGKGKKNKKEKKQNNNGKIKQKNKKEKNNKKVNGLLARSQRYAKDIKKEYKDKNKNKKTKVKNNNKNNEKPKQNKKRKTVKEKERRKNIKYRKFKKILKQKKKGKKKNGKKKKKKGNSNNDYDYERDYYDIDGPQLNSARTAQLRAESPGDPTERTVGEWPWITSLTYDKKYVCSGYIVSPKFVVAVTKCFHIIDGMSTSAIETTLTAAELTKIVVVVYDKVVDKAESHEAIRSVTKVFVNPYCDPSRLPQYCVLLLQLDQAVDFGINGDVWGKPKAVCTTCVVSTFDLEKTAYPIKLRGYPFLASYGLRDNQKEIKYGTYKNDKFLNSRKLTPDAAANQHGYLEKSDCSFLTRVGDHFNNITEWYCIPQMGNKYTCDEDTVTVGGTPALGTRDYGAPLFQRIGRSGYKITWQVIAMLWDFECGKGGNAAYIPSWGFTQWITDTIWANDEPCIKRVRKSLFTAKVSQNGKGPYGEHNMTKPN